MPGDPRKLPRKIQQTAGVADVADTRAPAPARCSGVGAQSTVQVQDHEAHMHQENKVVTEELQFDAHAMAMACKLERGTWLLRAPGATVEISGDIDRTAPPLMPPRGRGIGPSRAQLVCTTCRSRREKNSGHARKAFKTFLAAGQSAGRPEVGF